MTLSSGLGAQWSMARETVWGTAVTPTKFYEFDSESMALSRDYVDSVGIRANRMFAPSGRTKATTRTAGGDMVMDVPTKLFGSIVDLMHGLTVTPTQQGTTTAYLQTHAIGTSMPSKSATIQINKPTEGGVDTPFTYPGSVLASVAFSLDVGGVLKCTTSWLSKDETTPGTTPSGASLATASYASGTTSWDHTQASISLNGSPLANVTSFNFTWTQPRADGRYFLGSGGTRAFPIPNGFSTVTGSLAAEFGDTTLYDLFRSAAFVSLDITAADTVAIASTYFPTIEFQMPAIQIRGSSPTVGGPDILTIGADFVAKDNGSAAPLTINYTSTDSSV